MRAECPSIRSMLKSPMIIKKPAEIRKVVEYHRQRGRSIGLVPTMGALHDGHLSIVRRAFVECDVVITTIFVNPAQFDRPGDLKAYPSDMAGDLKKLKGISHLVFVPGIGEMYPTKHDTWVEPGAHARLLCGASRPGHFRGVATICMKLFSIIRPDIAFFGEKDWQQLVVIRRMVADFHLDIEIRGCCTVREADGLAMSSRNVRLNSRQRENAAGIFAALSAVADKIGDSSDVRYACLESELKNRLEEIPGARVDYARILDADELTEKPGHRILLSVAVFFGDIRLIDNVVVSRGDRCYNNLS